MATMTDRKNFRKEMKQLMFKISSLVADDTALKRRISDSNRQLLKQFRLAGETTERIDERKTEIENQINEVQAALASVGC